MTMTAEAISTMRRIACEFLGKKSGSKELFFPTWKSDGAYTELRALGLLELSGNRFLQALRLTDAGYAWVIDASNHGDDPGLRYLRGERAQSGLEDLRRAHLAGAHLANADLTGANLSGADLSGTLLFNAKLRGATLVGANLGGANLSRANLGGANLSQANLSGAYARETILTDANLSDVDLRGATLAGADLSRANLEGSKADSGTRLGATLLVDVSLATFCRAKVAHVGPSCVDARSVIKSAEEPGLKALLRNTGMPDVFVEYMVECALTLDPLSMSRLLQSTFISYGGPDEAFAKKLNDALESRGVTTFFFSEDAPPGERLHRVMREGVRSHDRVILVCSASSLERPGLLNELEETLAREARDGGATYLIPIRLDDYVFDDWHPARRDLAQAVRDRVIADFRSHHDPETFNSQIARLIAILKRSPVFRPDTDHE